jgi:hypothetical protein
MLRVFRYPSACQQFTYLRNFSSVVAEASPTATVASNKPVIIQTTKQDVDQSPLKMRFLVMLVRFYYLVMS